jgi:LuxR family maltose regulon positive regulatory protein
MTMTFSLHENFDFRDLETGYEVASTSAGNSASFSEEIHFFAEKLCIPALKNQIERPRLSEVLSKSSAQFGATLITGRAGTGKTTLAAQFAEQYDQTVWLSIDAADTDWQIFSAYFSAGLRGTNMRRKMTKKDLENSAVPLEEISGYVENLLIEFSQISSTEPRLIVLDDAHYLFDAEWFATFFSSLLYSLSPETHLLVLSRGTPSLPLWRLRSKQVLGVVEEKLLAFDLEETRRLFEKHHRSAEAAALAHAKSFGRVSRLVDAAKAGSEIS